MNTEIKTFVTPEAQIQFSNIVVDNVKKRFTLTLGIKEKGKRKFAEQPVEGTLTSELNDWFSKATPDKVQVKADNERGYDWLPTGTTSTAFQRYCKHNGIETSLDQITFTAENTSTDRNANPFRLVLLAERHILTLVNVAKRKRSESINPNSGEVSITYSVRYGKIAGRTVKAFIKPSDYRRLVIQATRTVELVEQPATV